MPRTTEQILEDLRNVAYNLSPEVISWDGERPLASIRKEQARLLNRQKELVKELGRNPTDTELYPELDGIIKRMNVRKG